MRSIERKVEKLEEKASIIDRGGKVHVLELPNGANKDAALKAAGIEPHPSDLVVFIRKFS